jgi:hypothetical protein
MNRAIVVFIITTLTLSCKKFPEDEALFHINTVKQRLCSKCWIVESSYYPNICFLKNNELSCISTYFKNFNVWEVKKKDIYFKNTDNGTVRKYKILRLDFNDFVIENDSAKIKFYTYEKYR